MRALGACPAGHAAIAPASALAIQVALFCQPLQASELFSCEWRWKSDGVTGETLPASGAMNFRVVPGDGGQFAIHREGLNSEYEGRARGAFYVGQAIHVVDEATYQEFVTIDRFSLAIEWVTRLGEIEVVYGGTCRLAP